MKHLEQIDFALTPFVAIWEITRSCDLACRHCRAEAINWRDPMELSTEEGYDLLDQINAMGTPIMVLSGGDPIKRDDIFDLVSYGKNLGMRMATIPAATPNLTFDIVKKLKNSGLDQMAMSLDGPEAFVHDAFRGVEGAFDITMQGVKWAHEVNLPLQINTVFSDFNFDYFDDIAQMVKDLGVVFWEVFFLVPMGRGKVLRQLTPEQYEILFGKLYDFSNKVDFIVKITEGQQYKRFVLQKEKGKAKLQSRSSHLREKDEFSHGKLHIGRTSRTVNAGNGFIFISHTGDIYPSGFLPVSTGNIREVSLVDTYREHPTFKLLRDYSQLVGKCGICKYRNVCGGSRSRAYAMTGNLMETDPLCHYDPEADKP